MPLFFVLPSLEPLVKCRLENTIKCARIDLFGLFLILEGKHSVFDHWVWCRFSVGASPFPGWGHFLLSENFLLWMGVEDRFLIVNFSIFFALKKISRFLMFCLCDMLIKTNLSVQCTMDYAEHLINVHKVRLKYIFKFYRWASHYFPKELKSLSFPSPSL